MRYDAFVLQLVRFLNRTSSEDVGYYLVQVRFTHGPDGAYQVHFEVLAAPIVLGEERQEESCKTKTPVNASRKSYLDSIHDKIGNLLARRRVLEFEHVYARWRTASGCDGH